MGAVATEARDLGPEVGPAPLHRVKKRWTRFILPTYTIAMIVYLAVPIFIMILYGFNAIEGYRNIPEFRGFTLKWYRELFIPGATEAFWTSIWIALVSMIVATLIGTFFGLALGRYRFRGKEGVNFIIFLAIAVPEVVLGFALGGLFINVGMRLNMLTIFLAHVSFQIAFVGIVVRARVQGLDRALEDAAQDLFATPMAAFFKVTLPLIYPGILAGALLAFVLSLDDFVITQFTRGQAETFPTWVFGATRIGIPPQVNVMGTLIFMFGVSLALLNVFIQRRKQKKETGPVTEDMVTAAAE